MKVKIKTDVAHKYNTDYSEKIRMLEGKWVDIDVEHLFPDQFNSMVIEGVSSIGIRIYAVDVEEVQDDERLGRSRCTYCGHWTDTGKTCTNCDKGTSYMEEFFPGSTREQNMEQEVASFLDNIIQ